MNIKTAEILYNWLAEKIKDNVDDDVTIMLLCDVLGWIKTGYGPDRYVGSDIQRLYDALKKSD